MMDYDTYLRSIHVDDSDDCVCPQCREDGAWDAHVDERDDER